MEDKEKISHQLTSMGALNPDDRPELQSCIDHFQNMYLGHKLETISKDFHNDLIFTQALTRWLFKELKLVNSIEELSRQFEYVVDQLPDNCYAVTHFIELLDMKCFSGLTSRAALLNKIQSIILLYRESLDLMLSTHASYERDGEKIKVKELEHLMQHLLTTRLSLDVMHDHTDHIHRKLGKLNVPRGNTREVKLPKL